MSPTILSRRYAPAASVQSVVLPSRFRVASYCRRVGLWTWCATSTASAAAASTVRYARRPRRTLYLHDCQRASRKLSVHAVALCALCPPLYCPGATRPRQACSQSSYLTLSGCQLLSQGGPGVRLARHRRRRQALYATRGGRGVRYTCTIVNAHHVS
jgi:hypothetical protein